MKKLKFLPAIIFGIMFCFMASFVPMGPVFAADTSVVITTSAQRTGNNLVLSANLQRNPGLIACVMEIQYDTAVFENPTIQFAQNAGLNKLYTESGEKNGVYQVLWEGLPEGGNDTSTGKLFTLTLGIKSNIADGTYSIALVPKPNSVYGLNASNQNVYYSVNNRNLAIQGVNVSISGGNTNISTFDFDGSQDKNKMPIWAIVLIVVGALAIVAAIVVAVMVVKTKQRSKDWKLLD